MKAFEYIRAESKAHACDMLARWSTGASVLAGGTDLLLTLRRANGSSPKAIVDISRIREMEGVSAADDSVTIGPLTVHSSIQRSEYIRANAPLLSVAASMIGSPQIRNRGTIGGNIMNAATCADTIPPLVALGASVSLKSVRGSRRMPLEQLFTGPYVTVASPDEILEEISFPKLPPKTSTSFVKLGRRNALSIARLSVACILMYDGKGRILEARIVPGAAFPTWHRIADAEQILKGEVPSAELFEAAGRSTAGAMIAEAGRRWSTAYKEPVLAALVARGLQQCNNLPGKERKVR